MAGPDGAGGRHKVLLASSSSFHAASFLIIQGKTKRKSIKRCFCSATSPGDAVPRCCCQGTTCPRGDRTWGAQHPPCHPLQPLVSFGCLGQAGESGPPRGAACRQNPPKNASSPKPPRRHPQLPAPPLHVTHGRSQPELGDTGTRDWCCPGRGGLSAAHSCPWSPAQPRA